MPSRLTLPRLSAVVLACLALAAAPSMSRGEFVYVSSFTTGEIARFDISDPVGTKTTLVAGGVLGAPTGLAFGPDGHLYIGVNGDFGPTAPSIARLDISDNSLTTAYTFSTFDTFPAALAFKGNDLLVGRNPFSGNTGAIQQLANIVGGSPVQSDYTTGGSLASSPGLVFDVDGNLYVSDQTYDFLTLTASGPVKRFDTDGTYVDEVIADGASGLAGPTGLAVVGNTLYTNSIMNGTILATDLTDDSTTVFADLEIPFSTGPLAALADGRLLSGDASGTNPAEIYLIGTDGLLANSYDFDLGQIGGLTVAPVPEPGTLALVGIGLVAGAALVRRRRSATMTA